MRLVRLPILKPSEHMDGLTINVNPEYVISVEEDTSNWSSFVQIEGHKGPLRVEASVDAIVNALICEDVMRVERGANDWAVLDSVSGTVAKPGGSPGGPPPSAP